MFSERTPLSRRRLLGMGSGLLGAATLGGCNADPAPGRYTQADIEALAAQRLAEAATRGKGPYGEQRYRGYRGLAELPWFELDRQGNLHCSDTSLPHAIDVHAHLGMSVLFTPRLDLLASTPRVRHLLDCDGRDPPGELDLDIYVNGNFSEAELETLKTVTLSQGLWGNAVSRSHTIPNLLREMDAMRVQHSFVLPIKLGLPFGDNLAEQWRVAIAQAQAGARLSAGLSVHPDDPEAMPELRTQAASGARLLKLHPTVQQFYPDEARLMPIYEEAQRLGLVVFFHGGRAGIEPRDRLRYALPRHYEAVLAEFPKLPVVLGHAGARDGEAMLKLALRYENAWLGIHGQSVTNLDSIIKATGAERLLFGTDWPWYHLGASLAKVLICTRRPALSTLRAAILRDNALRLFPELGQLAQH